MTFGLAVIGWLLACGFACLLWSRLPRDRDDDDGHGPWCHCDDCHPWGRR